MFDYIEQINDDDDDGDVTLSVFDGFKCPNNYSEYVIMGFTLTNLVVMIHLLECRGKTKSIEMMCLDQFINLMKAKDFAMFVLPTKDKGDSLSSAQVMKTMRKYNYNPKSTRGSSRRHAPIDILDPSPQAAPCT